MNLNYENISLASLASASNKSYDGPLCDRIYSQSHVKCTVLLSALQKESEYILSTDSDCLFFLTVSQG